MSTTTIRLPEELKQRVASAAERAGLTPHAFILDAIAEKTEDAERRNEFRETAEQRYAEIAATGQAIPWHEMQAYLKGRLRGEAPPRPVARKLAD